jgi:hypothetical protein
MLWRPCIFLAYFGDMFFFAFHNLGTFCRGELLKLVWIYSVAKIWSRSLILLFPQENRTYEISGINLCNLGAELSILRHRQRFRGVNYVKKKWGGTSCIPCEKHVIERPDKARHKPRHRGRNGRGALSDWPCALKYSFHIFDLPRPCPAEMALKMGALQFSYVKPCE